MLLGIVVLKILPNNKVKVILQKYLINDLDLAEGEVYVYRIYGRYTYAFSEFTYFSRTLYSD